MNESEDLAHTTTAHLNVVDLGQNAQSTAASAPDFLNVREASKVLRLSRNRTYELANLYIASGGASGLPAFRFGRPIRIPRLALEVYNGGPLTWPPVEVSSGPDDDDLDDRRIEDACALDANPAGAVEAIEHASTDSPDQQTLPFEG